MIRNIIIFDIVLALVSYFYGYYRGYNGVQQEYVAERLRASETIRQLEHQSEERQNGLIQNYLAQIDLYKKTIDAIKSACTGLTGYEGFLTGTCLKYLFRWRWKGTAMAEDTK